MDWPHILYTLANVLIALGMFSVFAAIGYAMAKGQGRHPGLGALIAVFFLLAGIGRLGKLVAGTHVPTTGELVVDCIAGVVAAITAVIIWPITMRSLHAPTYRELERTTRELEQATARLESARDHALEASRLKSSFVANISHELRTPLSAILGMSELVLQSEKLSADGKMMMESVLDSGNALLAIVNDILDLSKIEAGKIVLETRTFSPRDVIAECVKLMTPSVVAKGLKLDVQTDPSLPELVVGDPIRIRQILLNLIGNAIKFTSQGSITVRVNLVKEDASFTELHFAVQDTGIGIGEEERHLLFMPFVQVDNSSTRRFGGTGLGLTISKKFVEMMNGEIGVESKKGEGSTFWFSVPFPRVDSQSDSRAA